MKESAKHEADNCFEGTGIHITTEGKRHLRAALGHSLFVEEYVKGKVHEWDEQVIRLSDIARSQPHVDCCAFTHGLSARWLYVMRTIEGISHLLQPLEEAITQKFLPSLTGQSSLTKEQRDLLALVLAV